MARNNSAQNNLMGRPIRVDMGSIPEPVREREVPVFLHGIDRHAERALAALAQAWGVETGDLRAPDGGPSGCAVERLALRNVQFAPCERATGEGEWHAALDFSADAEHPSGVLSVRMRPDGSVIAVEIGDGETSAG